ncbi:MAG: zf-TFIIB domain-containing protein [Ignavibacteriaceae bacterium]|nr:zf-TFIIB domain-containing protein [Ignavibacteriaceae bacterium]
MNCPVCKNPLVILEFNQVEIDHCTSCEGIWLDEGELGLFLNEEKELAREVQTLLVVKKSKEKPVKCPICKMKMEKVKHDDLNIVIDKCVRNHGLWFDKGELNLILDSADNQYKIAALFKSFFSKNINLINQ